MFLLKDLNLEKHITGKQKEQHSGNNLSSHKVERNEELPFLSLNKTEERKEFPGDILYDNVDTCEKLEVVSY